MPGDLNDLAAVVQEPKSKFDRELFQRKEAGEVQFGQQCIKGRDQHDQSGQQKLTCDSRAGFALENSRVACPMKDIEDENENENLYSQRREPHPACEGSEGDEENNRKQNGCDDGAEHQSKRVTTPFGVFEVACDVENDCRQDREQDDKAKDRFPLTGERFRCGHANCGSGLHEAQHNIIHSRVRAAKPLACLRNASV